MGVKRIWRAVCRLSHNRRKRFRVDRWHIDGPLRRVARIHRRGALSSATRRGRVHPAGAFCSSSMAHAPPLYPMRGSAPPRNLEPGTCRNMYASQHPSCCHLRRGTGTLEPWNLHNLTAPPWNLEPRNADLRVNMGLLATESAAYTRRKIKRDTRLSPIVL